MVFRGGQRDPCTRDVASLDPQFVRAHNENIGMSGHSRPRKPADHKHKDRLPCINAETFYTFVNKLWFSFIPRINLSPFTKDFRGGEQQNESID